MSIVEVKVPQLSESVSEGTLLTWKKKPGEAIAIDEILVEVETDKVVLEVPAPAAGVLAQVIKHDGDIVTAEELIAERGDDIAQVVRGEEMRLAEDERMEILQSRRSYYPDDLVVIGWTAALVYDTPEGALPVMQLLEYANSQLIEFRYYDDMLTRLLADVYRSLDKGTGVLARWRLAREAGRLNTIRLDVRELTERMDNSIKFLSDMYSARVYRLAAGKVGVTDYRRLVDEKLHTAGDLYQFMMDQFQQGRAFVLELMVVVILVIELVFLFEGKM